jgi:hypothetical protein
MERPSPLHERFALSDDRRSRWLTHALEISSNDLFRMRLPQNQHSPARHRFSKHPALSITAEASGLKLKNLDISWRQCSFCNSLSSIRLSQQDSGSCYRSSNRSGNRSGKTPAIRKGLTRMLVQELGVSNAITARYLCVTANAVCYILKSQ